MRKKVFDSWKKSSILIFTLYNIFLTTSQILFGSHIAVAECIMWFVLLIPTLILWFISVLDRFVTTRGGRSFFEVDEK